MSESDQELYFCSGCMQQLEKGGIVCPHCGYDNSKTRNPHDVLPEGFVLSGRYLVGKVTEQNRVVNTYLGLDLNLMKKVMIKELILGGCRAPDRTIKWFSEDIHESIKKFYDKKRLLNNVSDFHIEKAQSSFQENNTVYVIEDPTAGGKLIPGPGLQDEIARVKGGIPWEQVISLFLPLMECMEKLHEQGILWEYIFPRNIQICRFAETDTELLLLTGFAEEIYSYDINWDPEGDAFIWDPNTHFLPLEFFISPKNSTKSRSKGPYTDVYGLCAVMYYAITGKVPKKAVDRIMGEANLETFGSLGLDVPEPVEKVIRHGLEPRGQDRPQSMRELHEAFTAAIEAYKKAPQEERYQMAINAMKNGNLPGYEKALTLFRRTPGWRDADKLAEECEKKISAAGKAPQKTGTNTAGSSRTTSVSNPAAGKPNPPDALNRTTVRKPAEKGSREGRKGNIFPVIIFGLLGLSIAAGLFFHSYILWLGGTLLTIGGMCLYLAFSGGKGSSSVGKVIFPSLLMLGLGGFLLIDGIRDASDLIRSRSYTGSLGAEVEEILAMTGSSGEKYVLYDEEKGLFIPGILPEEIEAKSAEEIGGIFIIRTDAIKTGTYTNGDQAMVYKITISLYDTHSGNTLRSRTVYGGEPPKTIRTKGISLGQTKHYGSKPGNDKIRAACLDLIGYDEGSSILFLPAFAVG